VYALPRNQELNVRGSESDAVKKFVRLKQAEIDRRHLIVKAREQAKRKAKLAVIKESKRRRLEMAGFRKRLGLSQVRFGALLNLGSRLPNYERGTAGWPDGIYNASMEILRRDFKTKLRIDN
jgi:DNA-binding transcriptional regulator YiaG